MASFPGAKVHRVNRRRLGRHQFPAAAPVVVTFATTAPGLTTELLFSVPVVVSGLIPIQSVNGAVPVSQAVGDPQSVVVTFNTALTTGDILILAPNVPEISTFQGGGNSGATGNVT